MERVWDYPRPPAVEPCQRRARVEIGRVTVADSIRALRVLETSHPPTVFIPPDDVRMDLVAVSDSAPTWCEYKGTAEYLDVVLPERVAPAVAWRYPTPSAGFEEIAGHIAFYPGRVDAAWLDDEQVRPQEGNFYGGWITSELIGPFKGPPGTLGW